VRDALIAQGLPSERLFLAAPKVGDGNAGSSDAQGFKPKVELSLAPR
jgi:hypothetical protein